jgi:TonB family protein
MALDNWQQWEGRVVGGRFALGPYLSGSERSAVYLTDFGGSRAVVKLVAADSADADAQLARWEGARRIVHPNLLRVYETGLWHADEEQDMFFAVMEYADENLAEILGDRPLTPVEARDMLEPTLAALDHLHAQNFVHADLKPSNVLAVGKDLKLALDGVRRSGSRLAGNEQEDRRAAPEVFSSSVSARNDVWAVGLLVVESLTGTRAEIAKSDDVRAKLTETLPEPFATIVRECLQPDSARRCSVAQIRKLLERPIEPKKSEAQVVLIGPKAAPPKEDGEPTPEIAAVPGGASVETDTTEFAEAAEKPAKLAQTATAEQLPFPKKLAEPNTPEHPKAGSPEPEERYGASLSLESLSSEKHSLIASIFESPKRRFMPYALVLLVAVLIVAGLIRFAGSRSGEPKPASAASQPVAHPSPPASSLQQPPAAIHQPLGGSTLGAVAHQVMPEVSRAAQNTIHGVVKVRVQLNVDESGAVTLAGLAAHGPSRYFAKQALEAARQWTFTPPLVNGKPVASRWMLQFDFHRSGAKVESRMVSPRP